MLQKDNWFCRTSPQPQAVQLSDTMLRLPAVLLIQHSDPAPTTAGLTADSRNLDIDSMKSM